MTAILVWGPGEVRFRCLSSTGDVLEMSVVIGVGGEWMRELGLGFTNPVGQGECWTRVWRGGVVWILCVADRTRYLCNVFGGYLHI